MVDFKQLNSIPILTVADKLGIMVSKKKTLCFIHDEKTPSLSFSTEKNIWKCFGCGEGGGVIDLVQKKNEMSFREACAWLEDNLLFTSSSLTRFHQNTKRGKECARNEYSIEKEADFELYEKTIDMLTLSRKAVEYLAGERALDPRIVSENNIKSIESISDFYERIQEIFGTERLISAGLLSASNSRQIRRVWWKEGIVFPYYNYDGRISMMQLRPYGSNSASSKYVLLKGIKSCLYNERVLKILPPGNLLFLCEGAPDTLSLLSKGLPAVGIPGVASFKEEWIEKIGQYNNTILFDNDEAGEKNAKLLELKLKKNGINVSVKKLKSYHDINDMLVAERNHRTNE